MTIGSVTSTQSSQLPVSLASNPSSTSQTPDQTATSMVEVAAGLKISGRTAQSLTEIIQASQVKLGYSKEEMKSFSAMIDAAKAYMDKVRKWAAEEAAAAATTDPSKIAVNANPSAELQQQQQAVAAYNNDFIAKMEDGLNQVMMAYFDHALVFQTFSSGATGDVNITAKTFKTDFAGHVGTDLSFSFYQSRIEDENSKPTDPKVFGAMWSVNDLTLFEKGPKRII